MTNSAFRRVPNALARAAVLLAAATLLVACGDRGGTEGAPAPGDTAVAKVDGKTVWVSDVKREAVAQGLIGEGEPLDVSSDLFRRVLDEVVDQKLLAAEALNRKLDKDPVAQKRLAAARERILGDMLVESVVSDAVNDNAIRGLYQEQLKLAKQSEEIRARQIVLASEAEAQAVQKLLAAGASFDALAMERSTDVATRFNGGDLGYFTVDVMPEAYAANLKTSKVGDIVGPFAIEGGWAILKIEDRRLEQPITFDAARPQIVRFLTYDQVRDLLEKLRSRAKVQTLIGAQQDVPGQPKEPADAPKAAPAPQAPATKAPPAASAAPAKAAQP
ncbi:peptidylprolyl isomerase [Phenylobacterium sp. Root77]|uniref:peptidylprolyl isomerase n=1 Tax=unclassified Phenylobacterium TaxID=2640670 RepID=UPI0006F9B789|nr:MULTISPECIES: peptidylprolyl isomerase [unclassified Phenylobacterium]KQW70609.1 peptidylprolyl isomerase [Phenylobacterium sp. Root1277]KQW90971.1 peptidylprolyl isomerase [Phenylobacterium sp. Root1290]KRC39397.1 peptidylprolyl isomerase [Phenylobacterium sp. Root77]